MTTNNLYNLTWGEYGTSLVSAVQHLRCQDELVDVTLAAGGKTFRAHKVVLCAASPFLLDLLKSTTCKHPVVMLAGIHSTDLEAILEFVYRGEVSVESSQLPSLLQAAHCLNIQGLTPQTNDPSKNQHTNKILDIPQPHMHHEEVAKKKKRAKRLRPQSPYQSKWPKLYDTSGIENHDHLSSNWPQQMNLSSNPGTSTSLTGLPLQTPSLLFNNSNQNSSSSPKIRGASDQPGSCPLCGSMLRQARNLRRHLITSCKYRSLSSSSSSSTVPSSTSSSQHIERTSNGTLHQLQTIPLHNVERVSQNIERIDNKHMALTPISCSELLPSTSSIISMHSTLQ